MSSKISPKKSSKGRKESKSRIDPILKNYSFDKKKKVYNCNECSYWTKTIGYVRQHMISHSTLRPFICEYNDCKMSYKRSNELRRHEMIFHLGIKQYVCPHCHKGMTQSKTLREHVLSKHLKSKPFKCDINGCHKAFSYSDSLKKHKLSKKHSISPQNYGIDHNIDKQITTQSKDVPKRKNESQESDSFKTKRMFLNTNETNAQRNALINAIINDLNEERIDENESNFSDNSIENCRQNCDEMESPINERMAFERKSEMNSNPLKMKRKFIKKKGVVFDNKQLFECNFNECIYTTHVWEEITEHFANHWKNYIPFDRSEN